MLILKHLFDWSYDDLEQEVRANLVYRAFTRIDAGDVPDAKTRSARPITTERHARKFNGSDEVPVPILPEWLRGCD